jgi:hypothetical protein
MFQYLKKYPKIRTDNYLGYQTLRSDLYLKKTGLSITITQN